MDNNLKKMKKVDQTRPTEMVHLHKTSHLLNKMKDKKYFKRVVFCKPAEYIVWLERKKRREIIF